MKKLKMNSRSKSSGQIIVVPPAGAIDVKGDIEFNSQFFEPHGNFQGRINYPARYADINLLISHPVGRWQIDEVTFLPQRER